MVKFVRKGWLYDGVQTVTKTALAGVLREAPANVTLSAKQATNWSHISASVSCT